MNQTRIHSPDLHIYADSAYDKFFCVKPPMALWLATLFLAREIVLPLAMGIAHVAGVGNEAISALRPLWNLDASIVPSIMAAGMLFVFFRRVPAASKPLRWLWAHGAALLAFAAVSDALITLVHALQIGELNDRSVLLWLGIVIDIGIVCYLFVGRRVRDCFADFPPAETGQE